MVQILEPVDLFLVEVLHFMGRDDQIVIEVDNLEPVAQAPESRLVLFTEHEPYKVFVVHLVLLATFEFSRYLLENPIDRFPR